MEQLRQYFNKLLPLPDEEFNAFSNDLMRKEFDKGETLLKAGVVCDFVAFIEDGAFRKFKKIQLYTARFALPKHGCCTKFGRRWL
jgi:CRP-like cAMP-binding protein